MQFFFEIVPGRPPIPLLPVDGKGVVRAPDGEKLFLLEEASNRSGISQQYLRDLWMGTWGEYFHAGDAAEPQSHEAAKGIESLVRDKALRSRYAKIDDEHFEEFLKLCQLRGLNPFANQVYPIVRFDRHRDRLVVELLIGIEGMRVIAHRTGLYAGCDRPEYSYNADDKPNAMVTVYRMTAGARHGYAGEALWDEFAPAPGVDEVWDEKRHVCISKCAEAAALRKAFPQELGGLYAPEEWSQQQHLAAINAGRTSRRNIDPDSQIDPRVEEDSQLVG
jgi:phage recombination protein Bet